MKTLILALAMLFTVPAFAQEDMGAPKSKTCEGVLLQPFEAFAFSISQDVLILTALQVVDIYKLFNDQQQMKLVDLVGRFTTVAKKSEPNDTTLHCVKFTPEEALTILHDDQKMVNVISTTPNGDRLFQQLFSLALHENKVMMKAVSAANNEVVKRLARLIPQQSL